MSEERKGEIIIFFEALLWGLFPVITILSLRDVPTMLALAWSTLFAAIFFAIIVSIKKGWQQIGDRDAFFDIMMATFIQGVAFYLLVFFGLRYTSSGNASLIGLSEIFFSFIFFNVWRKECISVAHIAGAVLMILGASIVFYPNVHEFRLGDLLILSAAFIAPLGNFFQRRARRKVNSETILFVRSLIGAVVIFGVAYFAKVSFAMVHAERTFIFLVINGFFLLGLSKFLWIEGIHRINVAKAGAIGGISPLLTLFFAWVMLGDIPTKFQLLSFIPMFFGMILLSKNKKQ